MVRLDAARPNPAPGTTSVPFSIPREARVACRVYDLGGRMVRALVDAELPAGPHALQWDGRDGRGQAQPAGVYLIRLEALGEQRSSRLLLLR